MAAQLEIARDQTGAFKRLWLECRVIDAQLVVQIQQQLSRLPWQTLEVPTGLHLTALHLGKPEELYQELLGLLPQLSWDEFLKSLLQLMSRLRQLSKGPSQVHVVGLDLDYFGSSIKPVLALTIESTVGLIALNLAASLALQGFLASLGIEDIPRYIASSPNLRWHGLPANFRPHISLGLLEYEVGLPVIAGLPITISLSPPRLANIGSG